MGSGVDSEKGVPFDENVLAETTPDPVRFGSPQTVSLQNQGTS
jgi:hypothetical protein